MLKRGVTANIMVRNEPWTIWEAIISTVPYADAAVIVDTGSTDETRELIRDAIACLRGCVPVKYVELDLPQQSSWTLLDGRYNPHPGRDLGEVRNLMRDYSPTEWIWTVDADEVYTPEGARAAVRLPYNGRRNMAGIDCVYLPILWTGHDPDQEAESAAPMTYHVTGRLFRNGLFYVHANYDLSVKWNVFFPGEAAHFYDPRSGRWAVPFPGRGPVDNSFSARPDEVCPIAHYEMATKPWRRKALVNRPMPIDRPPAFGWRKGRFGANLFDAYARGLIPQKPK